MERIEQYPLPSGLVKLSVTTTVVNDLPSTIKLKLESVSVLSPSAEEYIEDEAMLPEIISIAGLIETTDIDTITEVSHVVLGNGNHLYELSLNVASS